MKKMKIIFGTLAVVAGIAGAVATHATNHKVTVQDRPALYWYDDESGTHSVNATPQTAEQRIMASDCTGNSSFCENGYSGAQLNTANTPSSGVASSELASPQDQIFQP